jgi:hypothetical protein
MSIRQLLDEHEAGLYERFVQLAEKYQYRDLGQAVTDAIRAWVETHEQSDTCQPPPVDEEDAGPPTSRK